MVMVKVDNKEWYEDKTFKQNLDIWLNDMQDNNDLVLVFDGAERAGKSFRIRQVAKYCAEILGTTFNDKNIFFELQSYLDFSLTSEQYTVCVLDEGRNVLNKKSSMSKINKRFTNYISECAKKRQVHIIALPAFHDLDKYISLWRMKAVVHIHMWHEKNEKSNSGYSLARGKYTLYMNDDYLKDSYRYPYRYPKRWETIGKFSHIEAFSKDEVDRYESNKDVNMEKKYHSKYEEEKLGVFEKRWKNRWVLLSVAMKNNRGITNGEISDVCEMGIKTVSSTLAETRREF